MAKLVFFVPLLFQKRHTLCIRRDFFISPSLYIFHTFSYRRCFTYILNYLNHMPTCKATESPVTFNSICQEFQSDIRAAIQDYSIQYREVSGINLSEEVTPQYTEIVSRIARDENRIEDYCFVRLVELYRFYGHSTSAQKAIAGLQNDADLRNKKNWPGNEEFLRTVPRVRRGFWKTLTWGFPSRESWWYLATRGFGCAAALLYWVVAIVIIGMGGIMNPFLGPMVPLVLLFGFWLGFVTLFCCFPLGYRMGKRLNRA